MNIKDFTLLEKLSELNLSCWIPVKRRNSTRWWTLTTFMALCIGKSSHFTLNVVLIWTRGTWLPFLIAIKSIYETCCSPKDGVLDPSGFCTALSRAATRSGAKIIENCPVTAIKTDTSLFGSRQVSSVTTNKGTIKTRCIINCTGNQIKTLSNGNIQIRVTLKRPKLFQNVGPVWFWPHFCVFRWLGHLHQWNGASCYSTDCLQARVCCNWQDRRHLENAQCEGPRRLHRRENPRRLLLFRWIWKQPHLPWPGRLD